MSSFWRTASVRTLFASVLAFVGIVAHVLSRLPARERAAWVTLIFVHMSGMLMALWLYRDLHQWHELSVKQRPHNVRTGAEPVHVAPVVKGASIGSAAYALWVIFETSISSTSTASDVIVLLTAWWPPALLITCWVGHVVEQRLATLRQTR